MKVHESHKMVPDQKGGKLCINCEGTMLVQLVKSCWAKP